LLDQFAAGDDGFNSLVMEILLQNLTPKLPVPTQIIMIFALMVKRLCSISIIDRFYDSITLGGAYVR